MYKVYALFTLLTAVATVSAAPLVLNGALLVTGHDHVAKVHHVEHVAGRTKLRFVHVVPKVAHATHFGDGFASKLTVGGYPKTHAFLNVAHDELFVELLGLTDCKTWHATALGVYGADGLAYRVYGWVLDEAPTLLGHALDYLRPFLYGKVDADHYKALLEKGLPAHAFTTVLHKLLK